MGHQKDIDALRNLSPERKKEIAKQFEQTTPTGTWPDGMPASLNPKLVLIGISPGNSPDRSDKVYLSYPSDSHGDQNHFYYQDKSKYWEKLRYLLKRYFNDLENEDDAICLTTHLNLGTGSAGKATKNTLQPEYVKWASRFLASTIRPETIILFGYVGYINQRESSFIEDWNCEGGLSTPWNNLSKTHFCCGNRRRLSYREWSFRRDDGSNIRIVIWPNHPSRPPFRNFDIWKRSVDEFIASIDQKKSTCSAPAIAMPHS